MTPDRQDVFDEPWMREGSDGTPAGEAAASAEPAHLGDPQAQPDDYNTMTMGPSGQTDLEYVLHSVHSEPGAADFVGESETEMAQLIAHHRAGMSPLVLGGMVLLTALLAGPISILGTFAAGSQGFFGGLYLVAGGPVIEEMMKLGGLLFLLEKKPWYILKGWHIVAAAMISAALFGIIENFAYGNFYLAALTDGERSDIMGFRWSVTVVMHVGATIIGAIGLRKAWQATLAKGRLFDSQIAEPYIAAAVVVHGGYNALALLFNGFLKG